MGNARLVARAAYFVFLGVTDREPTTTLVTVSGSGELFVDFLSEIFRILHINASPEHYAKSVIADFRSNMAPEEKARSKPD